MFSLAGDLYSLAFYQQAFRVPKTQWKDLPLHRRPGEQEWGTVTARRDTPFTGSPFSTGEPWHRALFQGVVAYKE